MVHSAFDIVLHGANSDAMIGTGALDVAAFVSSAPGSSPSPLRHRAAAVAAAAAASRNAHILHPHRSPAGGTVASPFSPSPPASSPSSAPSAGGGGGPYQRWKGDSTPLLVTLQDRLSFVGHVPGTAWQGGFGHLATSGGGYYSYLYAQALSAAVWKRLFRADPFSRDAGEAYRAKLLARGAAGDPADMIRDVLGGGEGGGHATLGALMDELADEGD